MLIKEKENHISPSFETAAANVQAFLLAVLLVRPLPFLFITKHFAEPLLFI